MSDRDGTPNVYVRPFPDADSEVQVSARGGIEPVWARSGRELFYRNGNDELVSVTVSPGDDFKFGPEQILFSAAPYFGDFHHAAYDVSSDDQTFVMIRDSGFESAPFDETLVVVENWFEELRRLAPPADQ